ncbi:citrate synthase [Halanaerobium saccharolyticum]|uniref:citrate synthase (unknown stereospecificity) n=1 Tax=Halanaerobium saccharolyticum TaxID=43595 RepID=A0A4R7YN01_9FIRM|nr:citrate/2-methylcitrate synthase [Halanaerobium saccharolyticum]RAK05036.1 citrate synthase [Halanaerobium saccharolyticum]TDV98822.1 citrate synthase [Halanaerobium saccharolyticum]TDX51473.1 citrate synthase [Halanaerobium saccharolyticum]
METKDWLIRDLKENWLEDRAEKVERVNKIDKEYYRQYDIKQGLRNSDGTGVVVGFTKIGSVHGYTYCDGVKTSIEGKLFYRDIEIDELVKNTGEFGFESIVYLLLFGEMPDEEELEKFNTILDGFRKLPPHFTENTILKSPSRDVMNKLQRAILVLYSYDEKPDCLEIDRILIQSLKLIARFPTIISYGFQAKAHYFDDKSLYLHNPTDGLGTAANILHMIRPNNKYTKLEKETLDLLLILHAEHGGGNNSAFTTHVVSSSGTDTYSAVGAAVGSLKGPKHGGANLRVKAMVDNIKENLNDYSDRAKLKHYLEKILEGEVFDQQGLIYGMGHAVYTKSDPRAVILKKKSKELAAAKSKLEEFELYDNIEKLTKEIFKEQRGEDCEICANVDLYSGFVYQLLNIPEELFTPLFATARVASWCAHRIEQLVSDHKIIRPAYKSLKNEEKCTIR